MSSEITESTYPDPLKGYRGILCDWQIEALSQGDKPLISPFEPKSIKRGEDDTPLISYGVSSFGYDARIAPEFRLFSRNTGGILDPKNFDPNCYEEIFDDQIILPPHSFVLSRTLEHFNVPTNVFGLCTGKSTLARTGLQCLNTPLEPDWSGFLTLEFVNSTPYPMKMYAGEGGLQIVFFAGERPRTTYGGRSGKYMNQAAEIVNPRL